MEAFNEQKYNVQLEAYDFLEYPFTLETYYKPAFASELESLVDFIDGGCCKWEGRSAHLAQKDFQGFVHMICGLIAEKMLDDDSYRTEFLENLTKYKNQLFDNANSKTTKLTYAEKAMCRNAANGLQQYIPKITEQLTQPVTTETRQQLIQDIGNNLFYVSSSYFELVRIEEIKVTEA